MRAARASLIVGTCALAVWAPAQALEVNGNARVFAGNTNLDDLETDVTQQRYLLSLKQPFGPWLSLWGLYRYSKDQTSTDMARFKRSESTPQLVARYTRPRFSARLDYSDRSIRGTNPRDNFNVVAAIAQFEYQPLQGPKYIFQFRDESNVADAQLFGRDTDSQLFQFDAVYNEGAFNGRATYSLSSLNNNITGFELNQSRALVRGAYTNRFWSDRLRFTGDLWLSAVRQREEVPTGTMLAQPVPAVRGLSVVDTTPSTGPLEPSPDLIDGDLETPVVPEIDIGGSNQDRNIGLDLGVTNRVTRLEITVDRASDPSVAWEVYQSADNFTWEPIAATASFDQGLLRYTLLIPETVDRYFKAVNISPNAVATVLVTEMRALLDVEQIGLNTARASLYQLNGTLAYGPNPRLRTLVHVFASNDRDLFAGRVSQEVRQASIDGSVQWDFHPGLRANFNVLLSQFDQNLEPVLSRTQNRYSAGLSWIPYPALDTSLELVVFDEEDRGTPIRNSRTLHARASKRLYPLLTLVSDLSFSDVDDEAGGFTQQILRWAETLGSQPTRNWSLDASLVLSWLDSVGIVTVKRRFNVELATTWRIFPYLNFVARLGYLLNDDILNLNQRYSLSWVPGPKLAVSVFFRNNEARDARRITGFGGNVSYRLNRWLSLLANVSNSETEQVGLGSTRTESGRLGLKINF